MFGLIRGALSAQEGKELEFKDALKWACKILNVKQTYSKTKEKVDSKNTIGDANEQLKELKDKMDGK